MDVNILVLIIDIDNSKKKYFHTILYLKYKYYKNVVYANIFCNVKPWWKRYSNISYDDINFITRNVQQNLISI